jgi:hypothetical protein
MATASSSIDNGFTTLAAQLFQAADGNKDGKLSTGEFQSFLEGLLSKVGSQQTPGLGTQASAAAPAADAAPKVYQGMLGFDYVKLNDPNHTTPKYVFARATQDVTLPFDRASRSAGLQSITDYVKQHGYANATVTGHDSIDFGDGMGSVDVLTGDGQWWWGPKG